MNDTDPVAPLIPWYANGTIETEEREAVERHLPGCPSCRELLAQAIGQLALARFPEREELLGHIDPRLLTAYVEDPSSLDADTVAWIRSRLDTCDACREASVRLREVDRFLALGGAERAAVSDAASVRLAEAGQAGRRRRLWAILSSTVLRPAPALAYLLVVVALLPAVLRSGRESTPPVVAQAPQLVVARGDDTSRDEQGGAADRARLVLPVTSPGRAVLLELATELRPEDVEDPRTSYRIELRRARTLLLSETREAGDFAWRDGRGSLLLLLMPAELGGGDYEVTLVAERPGTLLHGQVLFHRDVRIEFAGESGR